MKEKKKNTENLILILVFNAMNEIVWVNAFLIFDYTPGTPGSSQTGNHVTQFENH